MKKKAVLAAGILLAAPLVLSSTGSWNRNDVLAETTKSYQDAIDAAKDKANQLKKESEELSEKLEELKKRKADMDSYIKELDGQMLDLMEDMDALEQEISDCEQRLSETQEELAQVKQQETDQYESMKRRIRYLYENGETGFLELFFGNGSLSDIFNQMEYRAAITKYDNELLTRYQETKLRVMDVEALLTAQLEELGALKETQEAEFAALTELSEAKTKELLAMADEIGADEVLLYEYWDEISAADADIKELERLEAERIAEEERKRKEEEERLRREEEERRRREEALNNLKASQNIDNALWPIPASTRITSPFGYRKSPTAGASTYHRGVDVGAPTGTQVLAALAGTVTAATYNSSSGYYIKIDHGNGVETAYMHASKLLVKKGDYVERGQVIMKVGSTGVSTGPHLHFAIYINGTAVNPLDYVSY